MSLSRNGIIRKLIVPSLLVAAAASAQAQTDHIAVNPLRDAYYGDLHLHTTYSFDAYVMEGTKVGPDEAYKFARGEAVPYLGGLVKRSEPLDFLAVTDHSENMGIFNTLEDPESPLSKSELGKSLRGKLTNSMDVIRDLKEHTLTAPGVDGQAISASAWRHSIDAANANYRPGKFTTFIAYEWSAMPGGQNIHRNVIFRGNSAPAPFSALDSIRPEDLWHYLDTARANGYDALAIPHNSNASNGLMFDWLNSDGKPIDQAYAQQRAANEPLAEISQLKGTSETHPELSSGDEFANYEIFDTFLVSSQKSQPGGSYLRDALGRGLVLEQRLGINPYKLGFAGASDLHSGLSVSREVDYGGSNGTINLGNGQPSREMANRILSDQTSPPDIPGIVLHTKSGALTGVWAESNTREAIFDALRRKETFATSGTRLKFRFFGGWNFPANLMSRPDWVQAGYAGGVPMGGDLPARPSPAMAPEFLVWAVKDPGAANLDRVQVVKVWLENGEHHEKIYDVAYAGHRVPDAKTGKVPAIGNTVDLKTATYSNSIGATELKTVWRDPDFKPALPAAYYLRVIEIPTPRWTTYMAVKNNLPLPPGIAATVQSRGWSSPIWYAPSAQNH